jgi:hypothetical protein
MLLDAEYTRENVKKVVECAMKHNYTFFYDYTERPCPLAVVEVTEKYMVDVLHQNDEPWTGDYQRGLDYVHPNGKVVCSLYLRKAHERILLYLAPSYANVYKTEERSALDFAFYIEMLLVITEDFPMVAMETAAD